MSTLRWYRPCTYLVQVGVDDLHGAVQHIEHVDQLVAHLLTGHVLQCGPLWVVLSLRLGQINAKVNTTRTVLYTNLANIPQHKLQAV